MTLPNFTTERFERASLREEMREIEDTRHQDNAFIAAVQRAVRRGRETAKLGMFVDASPPVGALRIRGTMPLSGCGSPAAMCAESGGLGGATSSLK